MRNGTRYDENALASKKDEAGLRFQQHLLLQALERQAVSGRLMTNPRVTGFSSFAKAVLNFLDDSKAPKTCKNLYKYLKEQGWYDMEKRGLSIMTNLDTGRIKLI
jgi:hypothetical protein